MEQWRGKLRPLVDYTDYPTKICALPAYSLHISFK